MTSSNFINKIQEGVPTLLNLAREVTWNKLSDNCKFILTEIKNIEENFQDQRRLQIKECAKKIPVSFNELLPTDQIFYDNLYDVNLYIYKATKSLTIINIRYYPRSSLDNEYRQKVVNRETMFHCKVSMPPWLSDNKEKFDVNWEHNEILIRWKLFWAGRNLKTKRR